MRDLRNVTQDADLKEVYSLISRRAEGAGVNDGALVNLVSHTADELNGIKWHLHASVQKSYLNEYGGYRTLADERKSASLDVHGAYERIVKDGYYNPVVGMGTAGDPYSATEITHPLLVSPDEASALYASGGIAQIIIDKKAKGSLLNGYQIVGQGFTAQELEDLRQYSEQRQFGSFVSNAVRDALLYGGAVLYPVLYGETPATALMTLPQLYKVGMLSRNCLDYFVTADRWNTVVVPNYNLASQDYLHPRTVYIPIAGMEIHSDRIAFLRSRPQPYWEAIRQLGWGVSDITAYARALMGYEIMSISLPIMFQQLSLLVHQLPLDGIIAQNGTKAARQWQRENEEQMRGWSILNPKAINSFGELTVLNRSFAGFSDLVDAVRKDVAAKSGLPEQLLFQMEHTGLFDRSAEAENLRQSETIRLVQETVSTALTSSLVFLACSLWGTPRGWESVEAYRGLSLAFDTPVVSSPSQKADIGLKYAQTVQVLTNAGFDTESAVAFASKIISDVQVPSDFEVAVTSVPKTDVATVDTDKEEDAPEGTSAGSETNA